MSSCGFRDNGQNGDKKIFFLVLCPICMHFCPLIFLFRQIPVCNLPPNLFIFLLLPRYGGGGGKGGPKGSMPKIFNFYSKPYFMMRSDVHLKLFKILSGKHFALTS